MNLMTHKTIVSVLIGTLIVVPVAGQTRRQPVSPEDRAKQQQVMESYRKLTDATLRNDVKTVERLTADDYIALGPNDNRLGTKLRLYQRWKAAVLLTLTIE